MNKNDDDIKFITSDVDEKIDKLTDKEDEKELDRVSFAHEIKKKPPKPKYMEVKVEPKIYSIDLNIDAHWWFSHVCTVFPLLLDQAKRTHVDIKDSFKPEKRLPDFNHMFIVILFIGLVGVIAITKMFGWW